MLVLIALCMTPKASEFGCDSDVPPSHCTLQAQTAPPTLASVVGTVDFGNGRGINDTSTLSQTSATSTVLATTQAPSCGSGTVDEDDSPSCAPTETPSAVPTSTVILPPTFSETPTAAAPITLVPTSSPISSTAPASAVPTRSPELPTESPTASPLNDGRSASAVSSMPTRSTTSAPSRGCTMDIFPHQDCPPSFDLGQNETRSPTATTAPTRNPLTSYPTVSVPPPSPTIRLDNGRPPTSISTTQVVTIASTTNTPPNLLASEESVEIPLVVGISVGAILVLILFGVSFAYRRLVWQKNSQARSNEIEMLQNGMYNNSPVVGQMIVNEAATANILQESAVGTVAQHLAPAVYEVIQDDEVEPRQSYDQPIAEIGYSEPDDLNSTPEYAETPHVTTELLRYEEPDSIGAAHASGSITTGKLQYHAPESIRPIHDTSKDVNGSGQVSVNPDERSMPVPVDSANCSFKMESKCENSIKIDGDGYAAPVLLSQPTYENDLNDDTSRTYAAPLSEYQPMYGNQEDIEPTYENDADIYFDDSRSQQNPYDVVNNAIEIPARYRLFKSTDDSNTKSAQLQGKESIVEVSADGYAVPIPQTSDVYQSANL